MTAKKAYLVKRHRFGAATLPQRMVADRPIFEVILPDEAGKDLPTARSNNMGLVRKRTVLKKGGSAYINRIGDAWHNEQVKVIAVLSRSASVVVESGYDKSRRVFHESDLSPIAVPLMPLDWQLFRAWKAGKTVDMMSAETGLQLAAVVFWLRRHRLEAARMPNGLPYDPRSAGMSLPELRDNWLEFTGLGDNDDDRAA